MPSTSRCTTHCTLERTSKFIMGLLAQPLRAPRLLTILFLTKLAEGKVRTLPVPP